MKSLAYALLALALFSSSVLAADPMPVFGKNAVILFQGDSITDGGRGRGDDPNHILGHSYPFLISAKYGALLPERNLQFINRGISGNKVQDLATRWQKDALDLNPTLLSILVGINNRAQFRTPESGFTLEDFEKTYDKLLSDIRVARPDVKIVLCDPFVFAMGKEKETYEQDRVLVEKMQEAVARLAVKYHTPVAHFQKALDAACKRAPLEHWVWDGIHPTYSGQQILADEWEWAVRAFWLEGK